MMRTAISPRFAMRIFFTGITLAATEDAPSPLCPPWWGVFILPLTKWRCGRRRMTMAGGLLVRVGQADERRFAPCPSEELQSDRQRAARIPHRNRDCRESGARREELVVVAGRRIQIPDEPRRVAPCGIDQRLEAPLIQEVVHRGSQFFAEFFAAPATCRFAGDVVRRLSRFEPHLNRRMEA